jgi:hypothetical protein
LEIFFYFSRKNKDGKEKQGTLGDARKTSGMKDYKQVWMTIKASPTKVLMHQKDFAVVCFGVKSMAIIEFGKILLCI